MDTELFNARWKVITAAPSSESWIDDVCELYRQANDKQRQLIRTQAEGSAWERKDAISWAQAHDHGIKTSKARWIASGLIFESIRNARKDYRETLILFCVLYHEGLHAKLDMDRMFEDTAQLSSESFAQLIRGFVNRPPENKSLKVFHFKWVLGPDGPYVASQDCTYPTIDNIDAFQ